MGVLLSVVKEALFGVLFATSLIREYQHLSSCIASRSSELLLFSHRLTLLCSPHPLIPLFLA